MSELEEAIDRVVAGPVRKSRIISEREKAITAYHEVGHALVARMLPNTDPSTQSIDSCTRSGRRFYYALTNRRSLPMEQGTV